MEEYQIEAIQNGQAYDASKHPEITRERCETAYGFMRDVFSDIDDRIEGTVQSLEARGVVFYGDLQAEINRFVSLNIGKYIKLRLADLEGRIEELEGIEGVEIKKSEPQFEFSEEGEWG